MLLMSRLNWPGRYTSPAGTLPIVHSPAWTVPSSAPTLSQTMVGGASIGLSPGRVGRKVPARFSWCRYGRSRKYALNGRPQHQRGAVGRGAAEGAVAERREVPLPRAELGRVVARGAAATVRRVVGHRRQVEHGLGRIGERLGREDRRRGGRRPRERAAHIPDLDADLGEGVAELELRTRQHGRRIGRHRRARDAVEPAEPGRQGRVGDEPPAAREEVPHRRVEPHEALERARGPLGGRDEVHATVLLEVGEAVEHRLGGGVGDTVDGQIEARARPSPRPGCCRRCRRRRCAPCRPSPRRRARPGRARRRRPWPAAAWRSEVSPRRRRR